VLEIATLDASPANGGRAPAMAFNVYGSKDPLLVPVCALERAELRAGVVALLHAVRGRVREGEQDPAWVFERDAFYVGCRRVRWVREVSCGTQPLYPCYNNGITERRTIATDRSRGLTQ